MRKHSARSAMALAAASLAGPAAAQQVIVQNEAAHVVLEPIGEAASLGSRAQLGAQLGRLQTSLSAAIERGGGRLDPADAAWGTVIRPASWTSDEVQLNASWAVRSYASLNLEAGDRERRTRNFAGPLADGGDDQLTVDQARFLRLRLAAQAAQIQLQAGAETSTSGLDTLGAGEPSSVATRMWIASRRIFARLAWRPTEHVSLQAGQAAQAFDVGWRAAGAMQSGSAYLTPSLALEVTPWSDTRWRVDLEETVAPIDPAQFAAYAQLATPGGGAPQPDRGWRYGLGLQHQLPSGVTVGARADSWRLASVTDLGPVSGGEAPVGIGQGARRQLALNVAAPLAVVGLPGGILAGELSWRRSQVIDPFTGARRPISGEAPYSARLRLNGAFPAPELSWSLTAKADGPQSLYQMTKVTSLSPSADLDGAVRYDVGGLRLSLELDNMLGGAREVTTFSYAGSRANSAPAQVDRRDDDARAVRISLRRGL